VLEEDRQKRGGHQMNFPQAIFSGFKKYFTFSGRATRSEYWYWILFVTLVEVIILSIGLTIGLDVLSQLFQILLSGVVLFMPTLAVQVRRLHDTDRTGLWLLPPWIASVFLKVFTDLGWPPRTGPVPGFIILGMFVLLFFWNCLKGTEGDNRFGSGEDARVAQVVS
jgi:uncharacterized membrane protein YhaH (DUF805 family)